MQMLYSKDFSTAYRTLRKAESLVDDVRARTAAYLSHGKEASRNTPSQENLTRTPMDFMFRKMVTISCGLESGWT